MRYRYHRPRIPILAPTPPPPPLAPPALPLLRPAIPRRHQSTHPPPQPPLRPRDPPSSSITVISEPTLSPTPTHLLHTTLSDLFATSPSPSSSSSSSNEQLRFPPLQPNVLPFGYHHAYFATQQPPSALLPDGAEPQYVPPELRYDGTGTGTGPDPPPPPPKRLWAGGSVWYSPHAHSSVVLRAAAAAAAAGPTLVCLEKTVPSKTQRSVAGYPAVDIWRRYGFLDAHHELRSEDTLIWERRTLIFVPGDTDNDKTAAATKISAPQPMQRAVRRQRSRDAEITITPSLMHLFNFSALTYNAHRIHYDAEYARSEGHRAALVHGPLTMLLLTTMAQMRRSLTRDSTSSSSKGYLDEQESHKHIIRAIEYRNLAPLYCGEPLTICANWGYKKHDCKENDAGQQNQDTQVTGEHSMWIQGSDGRPAVKATIFTGGATPQHPLETELLRRFANDHDFET